MSQLDRPVSDDAAAPVRLTDQIVPCDADVIAASLGDPERFAVLFDRHWPPIYRYCVARAGSQGEDIAAEVFRIGFSRRADFDTSRASALPWFYGIAANLLRRRARSSMRQAKALSRMRGREVATEPPDLRVVEQERAAAAAGPVMAAVDRLRESDREIVLLLAWADLTYQEIADALRVPIGTVRSRLSRARRRLRAELRDHE